MSQSLVHLDIYKYGRNFARSAAKKVTNDNIHNRTAPGTWSAGYLLRHIAETELFFAKMFFDPSLELGFEPLAPRDGQDNGQVQSAEELQAFFRECEDRVRKAIESAPEDQWFVARPTVFGEISPSQGIGILLMHTSYHAGQAVTAMKHGSH